MEVTKLMSKFLAWIISAQLILGALPHSPVKMVAWAETCPAGLQFNSILGRCLSTEQASRVAQASQQCESQSTVAAKRQCYYAAAEGQLKDAETNGEVSKAGKVKGDALTQILTLAGLTASVAFLVMNKGDCKGATSAYLIAGGSAAVVAGEILASKTYKKKMKAAKEKLEKINASSKGKTSESTTSEVVDATNVQVEAFEALISQEEAVIAASGTKKKLYMLSTAAYGAATVMAGLEWIKGPAAVCASTTAQATALSQAQAMPTDTLAQLAAQAGASASAALMPVAGGYVKLFALPATRTALAGVLTANNIRMIAKIDKESKKAKERKKFLEELRDQVMAAGAGFNCTSADRSNPGSPNCYCYGSDGKANPARNNSQVCAALFKNNNLASNGYSTGSGEAIPNFCTTATGTLDEGCSCRASNSCLTLGGLSGNLGGSGINLGSIPTTLNSVNNGAINGASLDEGSLTAQAARLSQISKQIEDKNPQIAKANKEARQLADATLRATSGALPADSSGGSSADFGEALLANQTPEQALNAIKQEIGRVEAAAAASNVTGTRSEEGLDFSGLGASSPAGGVTLDEGQLAAAVENNLANGNSDINTSNGTLFQILSNRFQRSGMRRLFGEPGLPAERPNESDISK